MDGDGRRMKDNPVSVAKHYLDFRGFGVCRLGRCVCVCDERGFRSRGCKKLYSLRAIIYIYVYKVRK